MIKKLKGLSKKAIIVLFLLMTVCFIWIPEKSILLCPLIFFISGFGYIRFGAKKSSCASKTDLNVYLLIGMCTFIPRFLYWLIMKDTLQQIGEVNSIILDSANTGNYTNILYGFENYPDKTFYFRMFPHKLCYPAFLHATGLRSQDQIILFQIFCAVIAAILVYEIGKCLISNRGGKIAGLLYALWPAQIVYLVFISEENVSMVLSLLLILVIIKAKEMVIEKGKKEPTFIIRYAVMAGIISGICVYFKDWCLIILIASLLILILSPMGGLVDKKMLVFCGIVILSLRWGIKTMIAWKLQDLLQSTINENNLACYLYVSLHPWNAGGYNPARYKEYFDLVIAEEFNFDRANLTALKITVKNLIGSIKRLPWLLAYKLQQGYHDDFHMINNAIGSVFDMKKREQYSMFFDQLKKVDQVYWMTIVIGGIYAAASELKEKNIRILWLILILIGGMVVILLIECEGRYKYCIQPVWLLCSVWGMDRLAEKVKKWTQSSNENLI